jgi:hypothetical protein
MTALVVTKYYPMRVAVNELGGRLKLLIPVCLQKGTII